MFNEVEKIEGEILVLEGKLKLAREKRKELDVLLPDRRMAVMLHKKFCRLAHMDQCSWDYERAHDNCWTSHAHAKWLEDTREILAAMDR